MNWRLIRDDSVSASGGLAADETLAVRAGKGQSPPTLRLYTYADHCALAGRFQDVAHEIRLSWCKRNGIRVNRRPTGGGAILMGQDQLGVALALPGKDANGLQDVRRLMEKFSAGIVTGLKKLGISADFRRKNDIEVNGRKLVGLGIHRTPSKGLLFHASILVDMNISLMLKVLTTPFEKISDKEIRTVEQRISTIRKETGTRISVPEVREIIAAGYEQAFGVSLEPGEMTETERDEADNLRATRYNDPDWIYQTIRVPLGSGRAHRKTPSGMLEVRVSTSGRRIKSLFIRGDFFAADPAVSDLEHSFRWHSGNPDEVRQTVEKIYTRRQDELSGLPAEDVIALINRAVNRSATRAYGTQSDPYGCFVNPGGGQHV